jgi:hypothetical protein
MDQVLEDNRISLAELVEQYKKKRKECPEVGRHPSLAMRMVIGILFTLKYRFLKIYNLLNINEQSVHREGILEHKNLLDQEFFFQKKMHDCLQDIIDDNNLSHQYLREYSHALKTLTKKYSAENTHYLLITIFFGLACSVLLIILSSTLPTNPIIFLKLAPIFFGLVIVPARGIINDTVPIYEELILLIDKYLDRKKK